MKRKSYFTNILFLYKGLMGYFAYIAIFPSWLCPLLNKLRGVKIENWRKTYIAPNVIIDTIFPEYVTIESDVYITRGVKIISHFNPTNPISEIIKKDSIVQPVLIKYGAFLGVNSIILPGVTIGTCSIIGAGSVVTKSVPDFAIVGGNPAKILGDIRTQNWNC